MKRFFNKTFFILTFALIAGSLVYALDPLKDLQTESKTLPPPKGMEKVHFGFKESTADLLWLSFIQKSFDCSKYKDPSGEHCPKRWGFRVLKTASLLAPKLKALYKFGAVKLSVLLDDHEGAAELFDTGLEEYSDDWILNYRAAYLYLEEINNPEKAADLMLKASKTGAPLWTRSLASRLYDESGKLELSFRVLEDLHRNAEKGPWKDDLELRMAKIAQKLGIKQKL